MRPSTYFCSLGFRPGEGQEQVIPPATPTIVRFPFVGAQENVDPWRMHSPQQKRGPVVNFQSPMSGQIWPNRIGLGCLEFTVTWMDSDYTELTDAFVLDPFGTPERIAPTRRLRTSGENSYTSQHWFVARPDVPVAVVVEHNGTTDAKIRLADFNLAIFTDVGDRDRPQTGH